MNSEKVKFDRIDLVGISVRTSNAKTQKDGDIAKLWAAFFDQSIQKKIDNKLSDDIYCVYTEYQSDFTGEYTTFIGCKVSSIQTLNQGLESLTIEAQDYLSFVSEGEIPGCIMQTWNHIWNSNYDRAYKADFDVYGTESQDPTHAKITTYLSII